MNDSYLNKANSNFVILILLLFPLVVTSVKVVGNLILLILVIYGLYILIIEKKSPFSVPELKTISWLTLLYFFVMLLSILQNDGFFNNFYHLGRKAHFALAPIIALAIYRIDLNLEHLLFSIKIGLIITGIVVLYKNYTYTGIDTRVFNGNIFGDLVLTLTFLSIVKFFEEKTLYKIVSIVSFTLGVYAVISSGNRGTLLTLVVLAAVYITIIFRLYFKDKKNIQIFLLIAFIASMFVMFSNSTIQSEMKSAIDNIKLWFDGSVVNSSSGLRLEMWSGSIEAIKSSPFLGHGYRNANSVVSTLVDPAFKDTVFKFTHLHNEYLTNLVSAGIFGLVSVLALLFVPFIIFLKNINHSDAYIYSSMGILLCVSYAGIGMTHIAFGEENVNALFIYFLAFLLPKVQGITRVQS